MKVFVVNMNIFTAGLITIRAVKGTKLYPKVCEVRKSNDKVLFINTIEEMYEWYNAITKYKPQDLTEIKTAAYLLKCATTGLANRIRDTDCCEYVETSERVSQTEVNLNPIATHIRKGHWHRYWVGSRKSGTRRLVERWIHPTMAMKV
jgi:hypothetical protein